jgi:4,5-DOPA dioxygenase extradiol
MKRKDFLKTFPMITAGSLFSMKELFRISDNLASDQKMPLLFLGHGSPMNAIEENEFVAGFRRIASEIPRPRAIVCVSAHWETRGTQVTAMPQPKTIHDFGGFPKELYEVQYPAPGSPELAKELRDTALTTEISLDDKWGLDHGAWSVIKHLYPNADIPVIQMSLDYGKTPRQHYELAQELEGLRKKGVLVIGSGNMVHNLRMVAWNKLNEPGFGFDWAIEANEKMKQFILNDDHVPLVRYQDMGRAFELAIPSPDHYLPLLYTLALKGKDENIEIFNDKALGGSLTMTSVKIG